MTRYRKIEVRTWSDENFRSLTPLQPSGQGLWFFLLTGPHTGPIPGLYRAGRAAMAEELAWELDAFDGAFAELEALGMAKADFRARLVWLPRAIKHNKPESPNVVRHWRVELDLLPECALKRLAMAEIRTALVDIGQAYVDAFDEVTGAKASPKAPLESALEPTPKAFGKATGEASPKPCPNQEQEQQQEQEQEQEQDPPPAPPAPTQATDAGGARGVVVGVVNAAQLSAAMRPLGINANPSHPDLITLAAQGTTPATVQAACTEAKVAKPLGPISMAYVIGILKRWQAEGDAIRLSGPIRPPQRASPGQIGARDASRMAAAASIGLGGGRGRDDIIIDLN